MADFDIIIDGIKYEYVDSAYYNNKNYIAYTDGYVTTISEYVFDGVHAEFKALDDNTFKQVSVVMGL